MMYAEQTKFLRP